MKQYNRIEQQVEKTKINEWIDSYTKNGWTIYSYQELPCHNLDYVRLIVLFEKQENKKSFL